MEALCAFFCNSACHFQLASPQQSKLVLIVEQHHSNKAWLLPNGSQVNEALMQNIHCAVSPQYQVIRFCRVTAPPWIQQPCLAEFGFSQVWYSNFRACRVDSKQRGKKKKGVLIMVFSSFKNLNSYRAHIAGSYIILVTAFHELHQQRWPGISLISLFAIGTRLTPSVPHNTSSMCHMNPCHPFISVQW